MFEDWINGDVKSVLLVEPNFPIPSKSRNHKNFLPIGLLKIASLLRKKSIDVELVRHGFDDFDKDNVCLLYTSPSPRDDWLSRMPSSA